MQDDPQELKIAALIDAADAAQARALEAIDALNATRAGLQQTVAQATRASTQEALKNLNGELERAQRVVIDLQRLSLWRAAWQHAMVALVAIVITLVAVRWYVPSVSDMQALRTEKAQLEASIAAWRCRTTPASMGRMRTIGLRRDIDSHRLSLHGTNAEDPS